MLRVPDSGPESSSRCKIYQLPRKNLYTEFQPLPLSLKMQRTLMSLWSELGLWTTLEVPDWGFKSRSRFQNVDIPRSMYPEVLRKMSHPEAKI